MSWDAISAITGIITFLFSLFLEWPRLKERGLEAIKPFSPILSLPERLITISGYIIMAGLSLILSRVVWSYEFLPLAGRLIFSFGCLILGFSMIGESRLKALRGEAINSPSIIGTKWFRFIGTYLLLFGIVTGAVAVWDFVRWVQS